MVNQRKQTNGKNGGFQERILSKALLFWRRNQQTNEDEIKIFPRSYFPVSIFSCGFIGVVKTLEDYDPYKFEMLDDLKPKAKKKIFSHLHPHSGHSGHSGHSVQSVHSVDSGHSGHSRNLRKKKVNFSITTSAETDEEEIRDQIEVETQRLLTTTLPTEIDIGTSQVNISLNESNYDNWTNSLPRIRVEDVNFNEQDDVEDKEGEVDDEEEDEEAENEIIHLVVEVEEEGEEDQVEDDEEAEAKVFDEATIEEETTTMKGNEEEENTKDEPEEREEKDEKEEKKEKEEDKKTKDDKEKQEETEEKEEKEARVTTDSEPEEDLKKDDAKVKHETVHHSLGWSPPHEDPLLYFLSKNPMKHLRDFVEEKGVKLGAWFLNVEGRSKFEAKKKLMEKEDDLTPLEADSIRLDYWLSMTEFRDAVAGCPCNDRPVLDRLGIDWTHNLVEAICREAAARVEMKHTQFWNMNTPGGKLNYLGLFLIGESASYTDLTAEPTEKEKRAELRKRKKDRIVISQEEQELINYKTWWNVQVEKARDRIEQLRYEDWLRNKADSDLEYDWDLSEPFHPYVPPAGDDWNMNLYYDACDLLGVIPCSPFLRNLHQDVCSLPHYQLGPQGAKAISVPLFNNRDILVLDISDNGIGPLGAKYIAQAMKENNQLTELIMADNWIRSEGAKMMCSALLMNDHLVKINLSGNGLRDRDAAYFATVLVRSNTLLELDLSHNEFGDRAGVILGQAIGRNKTLRKIDLSWNHFKDPGSIFLLGGVRKNFTGLESVNLAFNGLSSPDVTMIFQLLKRHRNLKELDISGNQLTPENGVFLAAAMETNKRLEVLRCGQNTIGYAVALALLKTALNPESNLRVLDLEKVDVYKEFVDLLEAADFKPDLQVTYGNVMGTYKLTYVYQKKRDFAREILKAFNTDFFKPVRLYFFKTKTDFIDFLLRFDKIGRHELHVPDLKVALHNPVDFEFESNQLELCKTALDELAVQSTQLGFSSIRDTTINFGGFYVV